MFSYASFIKPELAKNTWFCYIEPIMPKLKSAKKRLRQNIKRRAQNSQRKEAYKALKRQIKKALASKTTGESLDQLVSKFYKEVDKAAKIGVIHKNKASRQKSRLVTLLKRGGAALAQKRTTSKSARKTLRVKAGKVKKSKVSSHKEK